MNINKSIEVVLCDLIELANEGDVAYRMAQYLHKHGWHPSDFNHESKRLPYVNSALLLTIYNNLCDIENQFTTPKSVYGDIEWELKQSQKQLKKKLH